MSELDKLVGAPSPNDPTTCVGQTRQLSPIEQLKSLKERRESELTDINEAIAALEKAPEVAKVIHLLGKALRY